MNIRQYTLFLRGFEIETRIGIHAFERDAPQRLSIAIEIELDPMALPQRDEIDGTFDYDWVHDEVRRLAGSRHFDLQETLAREIAARLAERTEIQRLVIETAKPDVYPDVAAVGCRIEARR